MPEIMINRMKTRIVLGLALMMGFLIGSTAHGGAAQATRETDAASRGAEDELVHLDAILDQAVRNLAARYNLNAEQLRYTNDLMHSRVKAFIQKHQKEAWPVLRELMRYQLKAETPDGDAARRIAEAALPLFEEAKKSILDANSEWREHLSDAQKRLHDFDLKEMNGTFQFVQQNLLSWKEGKVQSSSLFPPAPTKRLPDEPPTPPRPPEKLIRPVEESVTSRDMFSAYVDGFIKDYNLDTAQASSARTILAEVLEKAARYQKSREQELARLKDAIREAIKQGDSAKQRQLEEQYQRLLEPIETFFDDMVERLVGLLTAEQKQKFMKNNPTWGQPRPGKNDGTAPRKPATGNPDGSVSESGTSSADGSKVEPPAAPSSGSDTENPQSGGTTAKKRKKK